MRIARADLRLDELDVVYPGADRYPLGERIEVVPLSVFAGHSDWRLPNVRERQSIVDYGRYNPSIDPVFGAESWWYWSSSTSVGSPAFAWGVLFYDGLVYYVDDMDSPGYVRAVRG